MKYKPDYSTDTESSKTSGKGFYIALAICLVAVCGVAAATFLGGKSATPTDKGETTTGLVVKTTAVKPAGIPATNVKDDRTTELTTSTTTMTTVTNPPATTTASADLFVFPVSNRVLLPYSDALIYSETLGEWGTHNGVDFAADKGQQVKAPADGTIRKLYQDPLWGGVVELDHGGKVFSRCCGVTASKDLQEGQKVKAGQVIGTASEIPAEILSDSHIHVEITANDRPVDPLLLIRGKTVMATQTTTSATKKK